MTMTIKAENQQDTDRGHGHTGGHHDDHELDRPAVNGHEQNGGRMAGQDTGQQVAMTTDTEIEHDEAAAANTADTPENTGKSEDDGRESTDTAKKGVAAVRSELTAATRNDHPAKSTILDGERSNINGTGDGQGHNKAPAATQVSHRVNPDSRGFMRFLIGGYVSYGLVAFAVSFVAIFHVTGRFGFPIWMQIGIPVAIDLAILINAAVVLLFRARGENPWLAWTFLTLFTGLSVFANVSHALALGQNTQWEIWAAAVIAGSIPVAVFAATEMLAKVAFVNPKARRQEIEDQSQKLADQARLEQEQLRVEAERDLTRQKAKLEQEQNLTQLELIKAERERLVAEAKSAPSTTQDRQSSSERPARKPQSTSNTDGSAAGRRSAAEQLEEIAQFVAERTSEGLDTTGADLNEHGYVGSDRTGRRKLDELRIKRPEVFLSEGDQG